MPQLPTHRPCTPGLTLDPLTTRSLTLDELGVTSVFVIPDDAQGAITLVWRPSMPFVLFGYKGTRSLGSFSCNPPAKCRSRGRHRNALRRSVRHGF
jgi:hypothetical protein